MKIFETAAVLAILEFLVLSSIVFAASPAPDLLKAKGEAEAKGFIFETSHDEIVAKAKKEGRLRTLSSLDPDTHKAMTESFKKKYPFIDIQIQEITGTEASQRFLLELKAGVVKDRDMSHASKSHMHAGGEIAKIIKGKKVSINDYTTYHNTPKWMKMVLEAYGFPTAEIK